MGVLVLGAGLVLVCCGAVMGPVRGSVVLAHEQDLTDTVVRLRCSGPAFHGDMKTDEEFVRVRDDGRFTFWFSFSLPNTERCSLQIYHPRYRSAHVPLEQAFTQTLEPIVLEDWKAFFAAGPAYELNPNTRRRWPYSEVYGHLSEMGLWLKGFDTSELSDLAHYVPVLHWIFTTAMERGEFPARPSTELRYLLDAIDRIEGATGYDAPFKALLAAVEAGDAAAVQALVEAGALLTAWGRDKHMPVALAAAHGHSDVIEVLVDAGADVDAAQCPSPLLTAIGNDQGEAARTLLRLGANPGAVCGNRRTLGDVLTRLAGRSASDELNAYFEVGVAVDLTDHRGVTALAEAAAAGHIDLVKNLISAGADPFAKTAEGDDVLDVAVAKGFLDVEKALRNARGAR